MSATSAFFGRGDSSHRGPLNDIIFTKEMYREYCGVSVRDKGVQAQRGRDSARPPSKGLKISAGEPSLPTLVLCESMVDKAHCLLFCRDIFDVYILSHYYSPNGSYSAYHMRHTVRIPRELWQRLMYQPNSARPCSNVDLLGRLSSWDWALGFD